MRRIPTRDCVRATVALVAVLVPIVAFAGGAGVPQDVSRFIQRRDACDHFRGEEPYDAERRSFLERKMRELCAGTDAELRRLKARYRTDPAVMRKLDEYEPEIEPPARVEPADRHR